MNKEQLIALIECIVIVSTAVFVIECIVIVGMAVFVSFWCPQ